MNIESKITISNDKGLLDLDVIHGFLTTSYWAPGRTREQVRTTVENSLCFGLHLDGAQVGFARVVTDGAVFAYLMDVFILEAHRGKGYSKLLLQHIFSDPKLSHIPKWLLGTQDAHALYRQFGFTDLAHPERMMEWKRAL
ncbi:MAG: N-acetyltransferase [Bacteroidetes bacterium]|nr:MAG: N-acetyltransferase [Bacteroidota bacterium]